MVSGLVSLLFVAAAIVLTVAQLISYNRLRDHYPAGMTIAGIPVGGADAQTAVERLNQVYNSTPVEMQYAGTTIALDPAAAGFQLDLKTMLTEAAVQRAGSSFWQGFWDYLWNRQTGTADVALSASVSEDQLRQYLKEQISPRYDIPAGPTQLVLGKIFYRLGKPGQAIDIDQSLPAIEAALKSPTNRTATLVFKQTQSGRPLWQNLKTVIEEQIFNNPQTTVENNTYATYSGVIGFYLRDLQTGQTMHFGENQNQEIPVEPDIAFTASSTIKIPIMVSVFKNLGPNLDQSTQDLIVEMITHSENPASDALMRKIDAVRGPLIVTEDMKALGLDNTFMAGFFCSAVDPCAPLQHFDTPANLRPDISTDPDVYNQTTTSDMGTLLADLYQCSKNGSGPLVTTFPAKFNPAVCEKIIGYLERDKIGSLIEAGLPEGTRIAHKHGWTPNNQGVTQDFSDASIVYTPGGDYVLVIYTHHPIQALGDAVLHMFAQVSAAVYDYYNPPAEQ